MPIATLTAIEVLRAGGNAVDAAVAACAMLAVVEPQSTGLGGDCFCLYAPAGGKVVAVNGSGHSAAAASIDAIEALGPAARDHHSPHAVTIPGAVSGWQLLLDAHGTKGFDELLQPAIRCAEEGFPVPPRVAWDWSLQVEKLSRAGNKLFLPGGRAPTGRRSLRPEGARRHAARDRRARRGRLLFRAGRGRHGRDAQARRRRADGRGFRQRPHERRVRRADPHQLARPRRLAVPAERPRHRRADDSGPARSAGSAPPTGRTARCGTTATSRPRASLTATATPFSPTRAGVRPRSAG